MKKGGFGYMENNFIFRNINFSLKEGEVMCLLGPNGTGKSTLIKCLTKILPLDEGTIIYDGLEMSNLST